MADSKYDDEVVVTTKDELKKDDMKVAGTGAGVGILAAVVVVVLAFAGWYYFSDATPRSVSQSVEQGLKDAGDTAKDAKDAVTPSKK